MLTSSTSLIVWDFITINRKDNMTKQNDPFGFNKAINWDKLKDPKVLEELKKLFDEKEKNEEEKD